MSLILIVDDIAAQWGVNFVSVATAPTVTNVDATAEPTPDVAYDGSGDLLVSAASDQLEPGQSFAVRVVVEIDASAPGGSTTLTNQAAA